MLPVIFKLAEQVEPAPRHHASARCRGARCAGDMDRFAEVYNEAWSENWGFVAVLQEGPRRTTRRSCSSSSTRTGSWSPRRTRARRSAVAITMPDINQVLQEDERPAAAVRLVALPAQGARSSTACAWASSASSRSTSTRAWRRSSTSSTSTRPTRRRRSGARWAGSSRPTSDMNRAMEAMGGRIVRRYPCLRARTFDRPPSRMCRFWVCARTDDLKASPPMFKSPLLDRLTRVHPAVPVAHLRCRSSSCCFVTGAGRVGAGDAVALARRRLRRLDAHRVLAAPHRLPLRARARASARGCTG